MAYFILQKDLNSNTPLVAISETKEYIDLNTINLNYYYLVDVSNEDFYNIKYLKKIVKSYNGSIINYENVAETPLFKNNNQLQKYLNQTKEIITKTISFIPNSIHINKWTNYLNFLNSFDTNTIQYPLSMSFEEYLDLNGKTSFSHLQFF
jgi:hypothetical protein